MATSFRNMLRDGSLERIEIPMIQRDYAQGRQTGDVPRIRREFLKVLHGALTGGPAAGLDFIYGEVKDGCLIPLDGQQRLTTLFLLHWYLASRTRAEADESAFLTRFAYKTRYSARDFCAYLAAQRPPYPLPGSLPAWLCDQHGFASSWKHDPTIQSMLVVLGDIHGLFADSSERECRAAWDALTAQDAPAITFESLSLKEMGLTDELYIKMNSRGKPLTAFEHFKAGFEQTLREVSEVHRAHFGGRETPYEEFIRKVDQQWSDLLWPLRGTDDIIDDEFLRLFRFLTDTIIYRQRLPVPPGLFSTDIDSWARQVYGTENKSGPMAAQRDLFDALDSLHAVFGPLKSAKDITSWFGSRFTKQGYRPGAVAIFDSQLDLFAACCEKYGHVAGKNRLFSLPRTLLLFAVLELILKHAQPEDFAARTRTIRNLVFASGDEIRTENFPALLDETADLARGGVVDEVRAYNKRQIEEEIRKESFLAQHPDFRGLREALHALEDHDLLRGCLAAFELGGDPAVFVRRAAVFLEVFSQDPVPPLRMIGAALLACGDYSQEVLPGRFQFGSTDNSHLSVWRELLTSPARAGFKKTSAVLLRLLDKLADSPSATIAERLQSAADAYLKEQETSGLFDWRYYLVKYPAMRSGSSGLYVSASGAMGFDLCMMEKWQLNSYYRDPYLLAVIRESAAKEGVDVAKLKHYGWDGYRQDGRWIELVRSGEKAISCRDYGYQLHAPTDQPQLSASWPAVQDCGADAGLQRQIKQKTVGGLVYDTEDRIDAGAELLRAMLKSCGSSLAEDPAMPEASPSSCGPVDVCAMDECTQGRIHLSPPDSKL
jgi:hypothetical protein